MSITRFDGSGSRPISRASVTLLTIERPTNARYRPLAERGLGDLLHAVEVRREARDDEPLVLALAEQRAHRLTDGRLRRREARAAPRWCESESSRRTPPNFPSCAGRRAAGDLAEAGEVGAAAVDRA